ncbi:aspartate/glutamate racemase family protein [Plantactinospora endophytica]|uniref:Aspartate racemase n=1 Tax=Plantactinospora endophytica TaxID=673535 RepID=A0ABQ4EC87_9ACTN|nr:aspartate/glutamate racemase family protein [Plantactinospora endophytica]GIG92286.1 aspartate racemase [Plantactinospora endophytica]
MVLGVLGGMGPLASAAFVNTVYRFDPADREQDMARVLLDSAPACPDRTEAILNGTGAELVYWLDEHLGRLVDAGADSVVIACFTAHHFLPRLDPRLRAPVRSLIGQAISTLRERDGRYLLLCTVGARRATVFPRDPGWAEVASRVGWPDEADQRAVHDMLYRMKRHGPLREAVDMVRTLRSRYGCTGVVLGCTELHLVSQELCDLLGEANVVDPLREIARSLHGSGLAPARTDPRLLVAH